MHTDIGKNNDRGTFTKAEEVRFSRLEEDSVFKPEVHLPANPIEEMHLPKLSKKEVFLGRAKTIFWLGFEASALVSIWLFPRVMVVGGALTGFWVLGSALYYAASLAIPRLSLAFSNAMVFAGEVLGYFAALVVIIVVVFIFGREIAGIMPSGSSSPGDYAGPTGGKDSFNIHIHNEVNINKK